MDINDIGEIVNCNNVSMVCGDLIATLEITNCRKVKFQIGKVPTIQIDNVSECECYVNKENRDKTEWITSNVSEMEILSIEKDNPDPVRYVLPNQYVSVFQGDELVTRPAEY